MLEELFRKAGSRCIAFDAQTVCLYDEIATPLRYTLAVEFESTQSEWRQGVFLGDMTARPGKPGRLRFTVNGVAAPALALWADTVPPGPVLINVEAPGQMLHVYNTWDAGDGRHGLSQTQGAGMVLETSEEGGLRRYRCNDGHPIPTFDHLVFSLRIEPAA